MNELQIEISEQGKISTNLENLKAELKETADKYKGLVVQESDIAPAKKDLAELRKLRTDIEDRRKAVKKQWNEPYTAFENEVKSALAIIDEPINAIDKQIKDFETAEKEAKKKEIEELYAENVPDEFKPYMPFEMVFKDRWLNKSVKTQEIKADLSEGYTQIRADLDAIRALNSEIEEQCLKAYKDAGNSLQAAIKRNADYLSAKAAAEERAREEAERKVREEAERKAKEEEPKELPLPEDVEVVDSDEILFRTEETSSDDEWRIKIVGAENIEKVKQFLEFSEIGYEVMQ